MRFNPTCVVMMSDLAGLGGAVKVLLLPLRPLRNVLPSRTLSITGVLIEPRPRFALPLGVLESKSLTGESQLNLKITEKYCKSMLCVQKTFI